MKLKSTLAITALMILSTQAAHSNDLPGIHPAAANSNFSFNNGIKMYIGGSLGYNNQGSACNTLFFKGNCEDGDMSWKVLGGARFNPMFGAEVAYVDQGKAELKGTAGSQQASSSNSLSGYQLTGVGYLPIAPDSVPNLEVMGRAGVMFWERDTKTLMGTETKASKDDGISPMVGLGMQYQFHQNMFLRGEWEHTFNSGSDSDHETDTNNYSAGITYSTL